MRRTTTRIRRELLERITNPYPNPNALANVYNNEILKLYGVKYDTRFLPPAGQPYSSYATFCRPSFNGDVIQQLPYEPVPNAFCFPNKVGMDAFNTALKLDYDITPKMHVKGIFAYSDYSDTLLQNGDESPLGYIETYIVQPVKQETAEVRLSGLSFDDRLNWVDGCVLPDLACRVERVCRLHRGQFHRDGHRLQAHGLGLRPWRLQDHRRLERFRRRTLEHQLPGVHIQPPWPARHPDPVRGESQPGRLAGVDGLQVHAGHDGLHHGRDRLASARYYDDRQYGAAVVTVSGRGADLL